MKITKVEIYPLTKMRYKRVFKISRGYVGGPDMKWGFHVVVKIHTDEGIVGVGEARPNNPHQHETTWSVVAAIKTFYGPLLIGKDPFDINDIVSEMDRLLPENSHARTPIDFALYDIMGKATGLPVYKLIGGLCHDRVPLKFPIGQGDKRAMVEETLRVMEETGAKYIKVKIGPLERMKTDIENLAAIREAVGDKVAIQVDGNAAYNTVYEALKVIREVEKFDVVLIEQPLPKWDLDGMAELTRLVETPILADESVFSPQDAFKVIKMRAADVINIKMPKAGGIHGAKRIAHIAEAAGFPVFVGSTTETGIGGAGGIHFYVSTKNMWPACACMFGSYMLVDDLVTDETRFKIEDGYVVPPSSPGLGVEVDEGALETYSEGKIVVTESM